MGLTLERLLSPTVAPNAYQIGPTQEACMAKTRSILRPNDFGDFEPQLKSEFQDAFRFRWDPGEESPGEQQLRGRFSVIVRAAHSEPDPEPAAGVALMRKCFKVHGEIRAYLRPDIRRRAELDRIGATLSEIGEKIARLPGATGESTANDVPEHPRQRVQKDWAVLQNELRVEQEKFPHAVVAEEMARLCRVASRANEQLGLVRAVLVELSLGGNNDVTAGERAKVGKTILALLGKVSGELTAFCLTCAPPSDDHAKFVHYFQRLADCLPVLFSLTLSPDGAMESYEVPRHALLVPQTLEERRGAILEWLCTWHPEFFCALPGAVRRDHGPPASSGGKDQRNLVLRGVTAALVLLELVTVSSGPPKSGGDLFKATLERVREWISERARTGQFCVDTTSPQQAFTLIRPGVDLQVRGGAWRRAELEPRYPTRPIGPPKQV